MGSIVKTIGKVIKKVGKALKKIAPILLVAAAAYVGYGYMTGFQQGGWPQITQWGQSLMGGVSQGQTLSQAANAAGTAAQSGTAMGALDAQAATSALPTVSTTAQPITEAVTSATRGAPAPSMSLETEASTFGQGQGGLLSQIQDTTNSRYDLLMDQFTQHKSRLAPAVDNWFIGSADAAGFGGNRPPFLPDQTSVTPDVAPEVTTAMDGMGFPGSQMTGAYPGVTTRPPTPAWANQVDAIPGWDQLAVNNSSLQGIIMGMGKKAWGLYKKMWDANPGMAMWTTANVVKTIAALLDKSDEEESYRKRHVMGFAPGNWDDLAKKSGGPLPGAGSRKTGMWAGDTMRQPKIKAGPKIAGRNRTSVIDGKPQGLVGSKNQGAY